MAEKQYIERDRIVKFIENGLNDPDKVKAFGHDAVEILAEIHLAPDADVVEACRCKDCKHYKPVTPTCGNCFRTTFIQHPGDFCSRGKRKETTP